METVIKPLEQLKIKKDKTMSIKYKLDFKVRGEMKSLLNSVIYYLRI